LEVAVIKCDMQYLVPVAKNFLQSYIGAHPLAVFAIACRYQWKELAAGAARDTLKLPIRSFDLNIPPELKYTTAKHYYSLLQYNATCGAVAAAATTISAGSLRPIRKSGFLAPSAFHRKGKKYCSMPSYCACGTGSPPT
jgi:hypothetical protein